MKRLTILALIRFVVLAIAGVVCICLSAHGDEFDDAVARLEKATRLTPWRLTTCTCKSPKDCICFHSDCECPVCAASKPLPKKDACGCTDPAHCLCPVGTCQCEPCFGYLHQKSKTLSQAPAANFKHDCACPSSAPCNCVGICHCEENRADNRQPLKWFTWENTLYLWRGEQLIGAVSNKGNYFPRVGDGWGERCQPPIPIPQKQSAVWQPSIGTCRT